MKKKEHKSKGQKNIRGGQDKQFDVSVQQQSENETQKAKMGSKVEHTQGTNSKIGMEWMPMRRRNHHSRHHQGD